MSAEPCPGCGAELRSGASFCTACGATVSVATRITHRRDATQSEQGRRLMACLGAWGALLATNGLIGLGFVSEAFDLLQLELVGTGLMLALVLAVVVPDAQVRRGLGRLGSREGLLLAPVALLCLGLFMWAYMAGLQLLGAQMLDEADGYREHGWPLAVLLVVVLPPLTEEAFFRGALQSRLEAVMSAREALIVQAALFSVLHMLPLIFVSHFVMGLVFGHLRNRTDSLWPGIAVHAAWNGWVLWRAWGG